MGSGSFEVGCLLATCHSLAQSRPLAQPCKQVELERPYVFLHGVLAAFVLVRLYKGVSSALHRKEARRPIYAMELVCICAVGLFMSVSSLLKVFTDQCQGGLGIQAWICGVTVAQLTIDTMLIAMCVQFARVTQCFFTLVFIPWHSGLIILILSGWLSSDELGSCNDRFALFRMYHACFAVRRHGRARNQSVLAVLAAVHSRERVAHRLLESGTSAQLKVPSACGWSWYGRTH